MVLLALVCLALAASGLLLGASSATVSATERARAAVDPPLPFTKLFFEQAYAPRNAIVRVGYYTDRSEPVQRTIVRESPRRVAIELFVVKPRPPYVSSYVGIVRCLTVPLKHPLGHRRLIDGATGRPPTYHPGVNADATIFRVLHLNIRRRRCPRAPSIRRIS